MTAAALLRRSRDGASGSDHLAASGGRRFYDAAAAAWMIKIFPGEFHIVDSPDEFLFTVLGSCVAACIRDRRTGIGGMNHFMLPEGRTDGWDDPQSARYGNFAMEKLINELLKRGCAREHMEVKVFGGGNVIDNTTRIGTQNAEFVLRYLEAEGLTCNVRDLGGPYPRRIHYFPSSGRVARRFLGATDLGTVVRDESAYASRLTAKPLAGEIQLFGDDE